MAGRQSGASTGQGRCAPFFRWGRAYAEGRADFSPAGSGVNPHTATSPARTAWQNGYDNRADPTYKYETAVT